MENKDFEIEQESLDMNNLALSNATKYLATYKNPKEWILDEKEAKAARVFKSVAPEKSSKVGSLAYSAGEVLRTTAALPRQFVGSVDLLSSALKDRFYPNAEESAVERWANNYGKLEAQREETSQELISQEVGDIDWYTWGAAGGQLIRDIALTGGIAKLGAKAATKAAEKRLAGTLAGEEVAQRYTRLMAGEGAKKAGSVAITGSVFAQEVGSRTVDDINQYIARTGDADLKYYDPSVDLAVNIGVGALSAQIEKGLGVERFVPRLIARGAGEKIPGLTQILARGAEGMVGESLEEGAQETAGQIGEMIKGYRDWWDFDTDQILTSMTIGGVLGGTAGAGLYYINRRTAINRLVNEGMDKNLAADLVDTIASREINKTINNLSAATELNTKNGEAYDKLKAGIKRALELQGWSEKMIDPKTGAELSIDEYVDLTVNSQIINTAVREAFNSGITIDEFLDVAQFTAVDNFMVLRPLGTTEEINARIDEQKAIIARQQDLKKTGAGDNTILREAKMKKAILEKVRLNKIVNDEIQKVNLEEAKTPENVKEIETADKDVEALKTAPTASDFNASLDNNLTTAQKTKRLGNAVLKKIFGSDKLGFDSVITLPEYTNAKTALTNSAERIINFAKKHRTYGIQTDLHNALNLMRTVNQGNFLEHATTPSLDGTDVIAQNAFLYHFLFKDADTTSAFIDAYLERAEASISGETDTKLTKKDLVGQAFKATDNLMQVQAESAGIEYNSIYNEDGSYKDQNVAAVMMSYQNQFADDSQAKTAEEQKEIEEVAAQVVDGTATTGTPESVSENFIQDYGEKIEGAKKDLVPKTEQEKTENQVVGLLKRSKFNELQIFEFNKWAQEQPYELLEKLLSSRVTLEARTSLDAYKFIRDNDLYNVSVEERQQRVRDAGIRLFDFYFKKPKGRLSELTVEALDAYVNARKQIQFTYQASTRGKLFLWGKKGNGGWLPLIEFATKEEMQAHKDSHSQEDLEKLYTEMTSYKQGERKVLRPRTGVDYRNGKNVTEKEFAEKFGFRGVQFGNYENQQKRQREINNSYDSFMDLATLLNVPPKAISLGGTLGIAFGARGSGSAAAHYEPDLKVINITRDSGAGALAHEWFHALDNYLAQNITNASKGDFLTNVRKRRVYTKNLELNDALADYMWEIGRQKDFQSRLRLLGQYWKRDWEVAARIFEQYVSSKIAEQNGINDYLASPQDYYLAETPYLKEDEAKNVFPTIEKIVKALKVQEEGDSVILYQQGFASMRGELIGDALDADLAYGFGEGTDVWFWGNYLLADKELDKIYYYDRFSRGTPDLKYENKVLDKRTLNSLGVTFPETQNLLINRLPDLSLTKDWFIKTLKTYLKNSEALYAEHIDDVVKLYDFEQILEDEKFTEEEIRQTIKDIEKISLGAGATTGALFGFPESTEEGKIQAKYLKDPKKKELFKEVYEKLVNIFGGGDYLTTYANTFTRTLADLESQRKSLEAVKKLDFDKIGGRTGLLYKGKGIVEALNEMASGTDFWLVRDTVVQTIGDAIIQNKNVVEEINNIEFKPVFDVPKLKKDIDKLIAKKVDKNDKMLTSRIKGAFDALMAAGSYGESMEHILSGLGLTTPQKDIIYEIVSEINTSEYYIDKNDAWDAAFAEVLWSIRSNGIKQQQLKKVQELFKNAKESDFVYKPAASMYEFDVPASSKMISAATKLNKQSPYVQEAIMKFIGDYQGLIPALRPFVRVNVQTLGELRNFFDIGVINGNFDVAQIKDIQNNMMKSPYYKTHSWHVESALDKLMSIAVEEAVVGSLGRETTIQDIIDEIETYVETYKPGEITSQAMDVEYEDMQTMGRILKDHLLRKYSPDTLLKDVASFYSAPELNNNTGIGFYDTLVKAIERDSEIFDAIKQDESLGLRKVPTAREMASKLLRKYGIAGGRYYGKRDKRGFVTFGRTPMVKRLLQGKQANGFFDPELNIILLGKNWNTMTLPHELAHYWLNTLFNVYKRVQSGELKANAEWVQEKKDMFAMLGIDENQDALTAGQQEKFARMTEAYLTGIGVSKEMNQTFKDFFAWVPEKYKSILQLGYLDDQGKLQYPFLDQKAVDFFNRWYENASLPSLPTSPERQRFMNVTDGDGEPEKVSIKEMNDREKEFAQDAEEQQRTDARLYNTLDENMPADIKPVADAQKVVIDERSNFLKESQAQQVQVAEEPKRRWFERKSRETETQKAQEYIEKNPEHAKEVIFGDPELVPNDTGVDRATLINTYMALNNITPENPDWATLHTNIAINQSLAGTQLALSNDKSYGTYLDALREVENALELKAATNYAGSKQGARERFNADIQKFLDKELPAIFATEPNSKEREVALRAMFEKARTTFSGNTTGSFLNQVDLDYAKGQTKKTEAFMRWAINQIKKDAGAKLNNEQQAKLLQISAKAQQAMEDLDNRDAGKAVAAAQELRKWQMEKQALMGVSPQKFSLFGDYAPRAMLASFNTLVVANVPSTAINTVVVNAAKTGLFGKNAVSKDLIDSEVKRIKAIYGATGMNLAQMEKPTSPSLLHGEKYSATGQKWYDPYVILGKEDNFFRVPTFVNTLAQIASTDAKATGRSADDVFREYASINNQTDQAKLARKQALAVANMAVFTQNGALANCLNHIRSELNKLSRVTLGLEPEGFGLGNLIAPFLTTGANIAEMGIRGSLAPITTITTMVNRWRTGKALDPMKKLALRMDWTYFTLSAVSMVLLAALTSDDDNFYTDPYRTGIKYSPDKPYDSINLAGVWLDLDFFGPFSIPMRTAAKVIQAWKKDNGIGTSIMKGYAESAKSVLGDIPLAESIINNQVNWAVKKPGSWASSYLYTQANKLVPAQLKPISRAVSRGEDWIFEPLPGTTVGRKFNRNYGFDGAELTTQDLIELFTIKVQLDQSLNQNL